MLVSAVSSLWIRKMESMISIACLKQPAWKRDSRSTPMFGQLVLLVDADEARLAPGVFLETDSITGTHRIRDNTVAGQDIPGCANSGITAVKRPMRKGKSHRVREMIGLPNWSLLGFGNGNMARL